MTEMVLSYRLTLESPVVLSLPGGDPNSAQTLPYISGSAIAGAIAEKWKSMGDPGGRETFRHLFLDESVRYLNAFPEGENNNRLLPTPLSLCIRKGMPVPVYDLAEPDSPDLLAETDRQGMTYQYQVWNEGYIRFSADAVKYRAARQASSVHHQRDRELGRAKADQDPIFSYISLNTGERFIGKILIDDSACSDLIVRLLENETLYLGRSRSAQYGQAKASILSRENATAFIEAGAGSLKPDSRLVVTLLSDYIGIDENGHPTPEAFIPELGERLGNALTKEMVVARFAAIRPVSGYVNRWRMPRPVMPALQQGSVFVLEIKNSPPEKLVRPLLWEGVGLRRVEGFGRFALNWQGLGTDDERCSERTPSLENLSEINAIAEEIPGLNEMVMLARKRLVEQDICYKMVKAAKKVLHPEPKYIPKRAFLGRLRALVQNASDRQDIINFIMACNGKPAGKNLSRCKIEHLELKDWLLKVLTGPETIFSDMEYPEGTSLSDAVCEKLQSLPKAALPDADALLWTYQKRYADLVIQRMAEISKRRDA